MTTIILLAISIWLNIFLITLYLHTRIIINYWYKLYNELLDRKLTAWEDIKMWEKLYVSDELVFAYEWWLTLNKKALEKFWEIQIIAHKIIEEHKNKYYWVWTADIIKAYNKARDIVKD